MTDEAVEFTMERGARSEGTSAQHPKKRSAQGSPEREQEDRNGFPDRVRRKYYVVATKAGPDGEPDHARVYTDRQGEYLAFKDSGDRLSTRNGSPGVVRDMVAVAEHRGWETVSVRGSVEFRREAWLEATARGLTLRGYEPAELDHETLRKRLADRVHHRSDSVRPAPDRDFSSTTEAGVPSPRTNLDVGVEGRLVELGRARYPGRERAEPSAYVDLALSMAAPGGSGERRCRKRWRRRRLGSETAFGFTAMAWSGRGRMPGPSWAIPIRSPSNGEIWLAIVGRSRRSSSDHSTGMRPSAIPRWPQRIRTSRFWSAL